MTFAGPMQMFVRKTHSERENDATGILKASAFSDFRQQNVVDSSIYTLCAKVGIAV
jgi:hypothetical protein